MPLQNSVFNPANARTGEMSVTLSVESIEIVTAPLSILGVVFPSNPGFNSISFLPTASTCFSAGRAATLFIHAWKAACSRLVRLTTARCDRNIWRRSCAGSHGRWRHGIYPTHDTQTVVVETAAPPVAEANRRTAGDWAAGPVAAAVTRVEPEDGPVGLFGEDFE